MRNPSLVIDNAHNKAKPDEGAASSGDFREKCPPGPGSAGCTLYICGDLSGMSRLPTL